MFITKVILSFLGVLGAGAVGAALFWWGVVRPLAYVLRNAPVRDRTVYLLLFGSSIASLCLLDLAGTDNKEVATTVLTAVLGLCFAITVAMLCNALAAPKPPDALPVPTKQTESPAPAVSVELEHIASRQAKEPSVLLRKDWHEALHVPMYPRELYRLACRVKGVSSMSDPELLPTFFTEEAAALLSEMPNRFWFWTILGWAASRHHGSSERIGAEDVQAAIDGQHKLLSATFELSQDVGGLTPVEAGVRVAAGVLLVRERGAASSLPLELILNPICQAR